MTNFLIDTNVLLWLSFGNSRINQIKSLLLSKEANVFISVVSWWEIVIKVRKGKLKIDIEKLRYLAKNYSFSELPVTSDLINAYFKLPNHHNDPFDHMLLAQANTYP